MKMTDDDEIFNRAARVVNKPFQGIPVGRCRINDSSQNETA